MIGTVINQRYTIKSELGKGGMGVVYHAEDTTLKRDVALKFLSIDRIGTEGRARMLREAQTVARLSHPNIVTVFDVGETDEVPYIVMELVDGHTLAEKPPRDLDEIVGLAIQICGALIHAHDQHIIHRDLKPENIIIQSDGSLKLMDFGLARPLTSRITEEGTIMGTIHYMAPEQVKGKQIDHRTDLYAFGVILYELVTGSLPFEGANPIAIISQHLNVPVVPPRARNDSTPLFLDHLIQQLLEKDATERPQNAAEVLAILQDQQMPADEEEEEILVLDRIARGRMIGRENELRLAQDLWKKTAQGDGQLLLVSGEPGIGKTRFTKELVANAEILGGLVLEGASYAEGGMPYSAFRQILRRGLRSSIAKTLDIPEEVLRDLLTLAPELRSSYPDLKDIPSELPDPKQLWDRIALFINLLSLETPLLIVIEDIHWSDSGSLALARHLARHTRDSAVMLIYNYREVEIHENRAFHEMLLDFNREQLGKRIKLSRLDRNQTEEMLHILFNETITEEFLDGIYTETEGHPFFIEEVVKALVESGRIFYRDGRWDRPSIEELGIPQSVQVAIQSRLDSLPESARDILQQAAIFGREFDFQYLHQASGIDELELIDLLELAEAAQIVEELRDEKEEHFAFVHALIPATLTADIRTIKRRVLHRRAAEIIERFDPANLQSLAYHLTEAGEVEKAVEYHLQLADQARMLLANQEAIHSYQQALDYLRETDDEERTRDTLFKLALTYQNNFDFEASQQVYDEAFSLQKKMETPTSGLPTAPHALRFLLNVMGGPVIDPSKARDVLSGLAIDLLFGGLTKTEPGGNVVPHLARAWEIKDEGLRYVFHLNSGLKWSDDEPLTAHDFEYSWKRTLNPALQSEMAHLLFVIENGEAYHTGKIQDADLIGVKAIDDLTLEVELERPTGYFLKLMSYSNVVPQPQHVIEKYGDEWTSVENMVGCGPFILETRDDLGGLTVTRNTTYFRPFTGNLEKYQIILSPDSRSNIERYRENKVDITFFSPDPEEKLQVSRELVKEIRSANTHLTQYLTFNCIESPFDNLLARRALAMAINKDWLVREAMQSPTVPAHGGLVPPAVAGHNSGIGYPYDPVTARRLLAEAGYPNGEGFSALHFKVVESRNTDGVDYLCQIWKDVLNIDSTFEPASFEEMMDIASKNPIRETRYPILFMGWYMDYPDPHNMLTEATWVNGSGWKSQEFDTLIDQAVNTLDQQARIGLYKKADQFVIDQCVVVPLFYGVNEFLIKPWVKNYYPDADTIFSDPSAAIIEPHD